MYHIFLLQGLEGMARTIDFGRASAFYNLIRWHSSTATEFSEKTEIIAFIIADKHSIIFIMQVFRRKA